MAFIQSFEIGTTYAGRANVESLCTKPNMGPASEFLPYAESVSMSSGVAVGRGAPSAIWKWEGFIPSDLFAALRAICPGASASVYIRTLKDDYSTYAYYTAKMIWPDLKSYDQIAGRRRTFELTFERLVAYTP